MTETSTCSDDEPRRDRVGIAITRGALVALVFAVAGGALIALGEGAAKYGLTMFTALPAATGFVTAMVIDYWRAVAISLVIAISLCLVGLVFLGFEGIVCVFMASPIIAVTALFGAAFGVLVKQFLKKDVSMAVVPILVGASVLGIGRLENKSDTGPRSELVSTTITIDAPPTVVWDTLVSFEEVVGTKPLLLRIGLPVPQSCSIQGSGVGAKRTCHFDTGFIHERVTAWEPSRRLALKIEEVSLPGRHWLGFEEAIYTLETTSTGQTRVTRTTTVTSTLAPRVYWRVFESLGTTSEHEYVLHSLKAQAESAD